MCLFLWTLLSPCFEFVCLNDGLSDAEEKDDGEGMQCPKKIIFKSCVLCGALGHYKKTCTDQSNEYETDAVAQ